MSPVVGTVLVLFITLLAMGGIMAWGVPAIRGLQDHAEFQSVLTQMIQLNSDLRTLRDPQNTRIVTISMNQGTLRAEEGSRWMITAHPNATFSPMNVTGWDVDTASSIDVALAPWPGGTTLNVTLERAVAGNFQNLSQKDCTASPCSISLLNGYRLPGNATRIQFRVAGLVVAESWMFDVGRITYRMSESKGVNRVHIEMGGVFTQQETTIFIEQRPSLKEPVYETDPKDTSYLVRVFEMSGNTAAAGKGRHTVTSNLVDNYGVTRGRPLLNDTKTIRIQVDDSAHTASGLPGLLEEAFCNHFKALANYTAQGAPLAGTGDRCAGGDVNVLFDPAPDNPYTNRGNFTYELNHASVNLIVRKF